MGYDFGSRQRRAWLWTLARYHPPLPRRLTEALAHHLLPARRRTRALLRATLLQL